MKNQYQYKFTLGDMVEATVVGENLEQARTRLEECAGTQEWDKVEIVQTVAK